MQLLQNDIDESRVIINNHVVITIPWPGYKSSRSLNTMASAVICVASAALQLGFERVERLTRLTWSKQGLIEP